MKKLSLIFSVLFIVVSACKTKKAIVEEDNKIYEVAEKMPVYPGGEKARQKFISRNLVYPQQAIDSGKEGKVYIRFVVEKDSSVSNLTTLKTFDKDCAEESIRVMQMMKWIPGEHRGKLVRVRMVMPINFKLY